MSLNIKLDKPGPYRPGSTVSGYVDFVSTADEEIAYIDINFSGRCKVKIRKHDHYTTQSYRSRGYYFSKHLSLYSEGKFKHKAGSYTWPFTFQIPEYASRKKVTGAPTAPRAPTTWRPARQQVATGSLQPGIGHELENDTFPYMPPFRTSALNAIHPHEMPATFSYSYSGFPAAFEGRVEYVLVATLTRPTGSLLFAPKNLEASLDVHVKPCRPYSTRNLTSAIQTHESVHTISTLRLIPSKAEKKLTWREKTRSKLSMSSIPSCSFQVVVTSPRYLSSSSDPANTFPMSITVLKQKGNSSNQMENNVEDLPTPPVKLTSYSIWVRSRTMMRDNGKGAIDQKIDHEEKLFLVPRTEVDIDIPVSVTNQSSAPTTPPESPNDLDRSKSIDSELLNRQPSIPETQDTSPTIDLGKRLQIRLTPEHHLPPGFSTYNVYRGYTLGYKFRLECLGEAMDVTREGIEIKIIPDLDPIPPPLRWRRSSIPPPAELSTILTPPSTPPEKPNAFESVPNEDGNNSTAVRSTISSTNTVITATPTSRRREAVGIPVDTDMSEEILPRYQHHAPEGPLPAFQ